MVLSNRDSSRNFSFTKRNKNPFASSSNSKTINSNNSNVRQHRRRSSVVHIDPQLLDPKCNYTFNNNQNMNTAASQYPTTINTTKINYHKPSVSSSLSPSAPVSPASLASSNGGSFSTDHTGITSNTAYSDYTPTSLINWKDSFLENANRYKDSAIIDDDDDDDGVEEEEEKAETTNSESDELMIPEGLQNDFIINSDLYNYSPKSSLTPPRRRRLSFRHAHSASEIVSLNELKVLDLFPIEPAPAAANIVNNSNSRVPKTKPVGLQKLDFNKRYPQTNTNTINHFNSPRRHSDTTAIKQNADISDTNITYPKIDLDIIGKYNNSNSLDGKSLQSYRNFLGGEYTWLPSGSTLSELETPEEMMMTENEKGIARGSGSLRRRSAGNTKSFEAISEAEEEEEEEEDGDSGEDNDEPKLTFLEFIKEKA